MEWCDSSTMAGSVVSSVPFPIAAKGFVESTIKRTQTTTSLLVDKSSSMASSMMATSLTIALVLAVSVFLYGTFYYAYIPQEIINIPVSLQFEPCNGMTAARCSFPTADINLTRQQQMLHGQAYNIRVELDIPDSPSNQEIGMFMFCMNIIGQDNGVISNTCQSSSVQYRSSLLRVMDTIFYSPALISGWSQQRQIIKITLFTNYQPDPRSPVRRIHLEIQSRLLQVTKATLHLEASLIGLRHLMYRHPWVSSILGIGTNLLIISTVILMSSTRFRLEAEGSTRSQEETVYSSEEESEEEDLTASGFEGYEEEEEEEAEEDEEAEAVEEQEEHDIFVPKLPAGDSLMWFLRHTLIKIVDQSVKGIAFVFIAVICYEAAILGSTASRVEVIEVAVQDMLNLAIIIAQKFNLMMMALMKK